MTREFQQQSGTSESQRPGQMTAVMRAVAAAGPKVLRIGVARNGQISEERTIEQRSHVTAGLSEENSLVLSGPNVPAAFRLFELVRNEYHLNFFDDMSGRIALPAGTFELSALKGQARRTKHGAHQIRLSEHSRGTVVIGDTTILFQFVTRPPLQSKPQLPITVLRNASAIDWNTTIIAAASFLIHFLVLGSLSSDWLDPIVDDEQNVAGVIDSLKSLPPPPPVEDKPETLDKSATPAKVAEKVPAKPDAAANTKPQTPPGRLNEKQTAALQNQLDRLEMRTLGALESSSGPATSDVFRGTEVAIDRLDQAAASSAGIGAGTAGLNLSPGGGAIQPGIVGDLRTIGSSNLTTDTGGAATKATVAGPKGNATVGGANVSGGTVGNASRVVALMRAGFRACYQRGLAENPDAAGNILLTIHVGAGGEVTGVSGSSGTLPPTVVGCVKSRAQAATFDAPEGGSAVISVPVTFVKQ